MWGSRGGVSNRCNIQMHSSDNKEEISQRTKIIINRNKSIPK